MINTYNKKKKKYIKWNLTFFLKELEKQSLKLSEEGDNEEQSRNTKNRNEKNNMIEKLNKTRSGSLKGSVDQCSANPTRKEYSNCWNYRWKKCYTE